MRTVKVIDSALHVKSLSITQGKRTTETKTPIENIATLRLGKSIVEFMMAVSKGILHTCSLKWGW